MFTDLEEQIHAIELVDHHVHGPLRETPNRREFEELITESNASTPPWMTQFDSQVGFAIRRHCAPILGLELSAPADAYFEARQELSVDELTTRFMQASRVASWLIETGHRGDQVLSPAEVRELDAGNVHEVARLESILEGLADGTSAGDLASRFSDALGEAARSAVALKSIVAYRHGFDFDPVRPSEAEVLHAAGRWLRAREDESEAKVTEPALLRMILWKAVETGLPLQLHAGYGDPDLELNRCDPLLLTQWIKSIAGSGTDVILLHCYPFQRNAGYLAQVFPHVYFDVGLSINFTGAAATAVIAESMELAPFSKILFSSDAWGLPELHYLGATLWRRGMADVLGHWVAADEWLAGDAIRVATMMGSGNANRLYGLRP